MRTTPDLLVEVVDPDGIRRGQFSNGSITKLSASRVRRAGGSWAVEAVGESDLAARLAGPGWRALIRLNGAVFTSGPLVFAQLDTSRDSPSGTWTLQGTDDTAALWLPLAWPSPTTGNLDAQVGSGGTGYDVRTGPAADVIRGLVRDNLGANAPADQRLAGLVVGSDDHTGPTVTVSARFDQLGDLLADVAVLGDLDFRLTQTADHTLTLSVTSPRDLSRLVRYDVDNGSLDSVRYSYQAPTVERVIVAGQGEGEARTLRLVTSAEAADAAALWGRFRAEKFLDQRQTDDPAELDAAGVKALEEGGRTTTALEVALSEARVARWGAADEPDVGDVVTVVVGKTSVASPLTALTLERDTDGTRLKGTVGDLAAAARTPLLHLLEANRATARRIGQLERRT